MAISNFQPTIWAATLLDTLKNSLVFGADGVVNRDYEGEITGMGSSVKITSVSDPTVSDYVKDTDITVQSLTDASRTLPIDKQKVFAFEVDDIDKAQAANGGGLLTQAAVQAGYALRNVADGLIATSMKTDAGNKLGARPVSSVDLAFQLLIDFRTKLKKNNAPDEGRWVIVNPEMYGKLLFDNRFINAQASGSTDALLNGRVGRALGMTVYESNNCASGATAGTSFIITAGHAMAATYADQIVQVEAARMEKRFADLLKGLHVYGIKVTRPEILVTADVTVS